MACDGLCMYQYHHIGINIYLFLFFFSFFLFLTSSRLRCHRIVCIYCLLYLLIDDIIRKWNGMAQCNEIFFSSDEWNRKKNIYCETKERRFDDEVAREFSVYKIQTSILDCRECLFFCRCRMDGTILHSRTQPLYASHRYQYALSWLFSRSERCSFLLFFLHLNLHTELSATCFLPYRILRARTQNDSSFIFRMFFSSQSFFSIFDMYSMLLNLIEQIKTSERKIGG